jgi:hypothetical protein
MGKIKAVLMNILEDNVSEAEAQYLLGNYFGSSKDFVDSDKKSEYQDSEDDYGDPQELSF